MKNTFRWTFAWFALVFTLYLVASAPLRAGETNSYFPPARVDYLALLPPPPTANSVEQAADLNEVRMVHSECTPNEAELAISETKFDLFFSFSPAVGSFFQPGKFPKTEALLARVYKTTSGVTDSAKDYWQRPRPFVVDTNLAVGALEKSFGYPSGHSTRGTVFSLLLAELFPAHRDAILAEGRTMGWHRVEIARHYPTDIFAGRVLAQAIVRQLKSTPEFQAEFAAAKTEIAASHLDATASVQK